MGKPFRSIVLYLTGVVLAGAALPAPAQRPHDPEPSRAICRAELRSWIVAGRGRHLYLDLECPPPYEHLSGRIEFGQASLRWDYTPPIDPRRAERVSRTSRGGRLHPFSGIGVEDNRLEGVFQITPEQAECLQRDRMWSARYVLIGANSNAAMLRILQDCDCEPPTQVVNGAGLFGDFPGVNAALGAEIDPAEWPAYGVPGPTFPAPPAGPLVATRE